MGSRDERCCSPDEFGPHLTGDGELWWAVEKRGNSLREEAVLENLKDHS